MRGYIYDSLSLLLRYPSSVGAVTGMTASGAPGYDEIKNYEFLRIERVAHYGPLIVDSVCSDINQGLAVSRHSAIAFLTQMLRCLLAESTFSYAVGGAAANLGKIGAQIINPLGGGQLVQVGQPGAQSFNAAHEALMQIIMELSSRGQLARMMGVFGSFAPARLGIVQSQSIQAAPIDLNLVSATLDLFSLIAATKEGADCLLSVDALNKILYVPLLMNINPPAQGAVSQSDITPILACVRLLQSLSYSLQHRGLSDHVATFLRVHQRMLLPTLKALMNPHLNVGANSLNASDLSAITGICELLVAVATEGRTNVDPSGTITAIHYVCGLAPTTSQPGAVNFDGEVVYPEALATMLAVLVPLLDSWTSTNRIPTTLNHSLPSSHIPISAPVQPQPFSIFTHPTTGVGAKEQWWWDIEPRTDEERHMEQRILLSKKGPVVPTTGVRPDDNVPKGIIERLFNINYGIREWNTFHQYKLISALTTTLHAIKAVRHMAAFYRHEAYTEAVLAQAQLQSALTNPAIQAQAVAAANGDGMYGLPPAPPPPPAGVHTLPGPVCLTSHFSTLLHCLRASIALVLDTHAQKCLTIRSPTPLNLDSPPNTTIANQSLAEIGVDEDIVSILCDISGNSIGAVYDLLFVMPQSAANEWREDLHRVTLALVDAKQVHQGCYVALVAKQIRETLQIQ